VLSLADFDCLSHTQNRRTSTASIKSKMDVDEPVESAVAAVPSTSAISPPLATTTTEASALPYAARESSPLTDDPDDALPFASSSAPKSRSLRRTSRAVKKTYEDDEDEDEFSKDDEDEDEFSKADDEEEFAEETDEDEKSKAKGRKKAPAAAKGGKGKGKAAAAAYLKAGGGGKGGKTTKLSRADKERMKVAFRPLSSASLFSPRDRLLTLRSLPLVDTVDQVPHEMP
jgi:hypothetical protein